MARSSKSKTETVQEDEVLETENENDNEGEGEGEGNGEGNYVADPRLTRAEWTFDSEKALAAHEEAKKAATAYAKVEHDYDNNLSLRKLASKVFSVVNTVMPPHEIDKLYAQVRAVDHVVQGRDVLPEVVLAFLKDNNLPAPHFNSTNPVQGIAAAYYQSARLQLKYIKAPAAQAAIDADSEPVVREDLIGDDDAAKKARLALNTATSKFSKLMLAAWETYADTKLGEKLFNVSYERAMGQYEEWKQKHPALRLSVDPPQSKRGGLTKAERAQRAAAAKAAADLRADQTMVAGAGDTILSDAPPSSTMGNDDDSNVNVGDGVIDIEGETVEGDTVEAKPEPTPEPERRWNSVDEPLHLTAESLGELRHVLPASGDLTFSFDGTTLTINGWVGVDAPVSPETVEQVETVETVETVAAEGSPQPEVA